MNTPNKQAEQIKKIEKQIETNCSLLEVEYQKGIKEGKAQAISKFKEKLKEALCIDKDEDCKVNCCKTQGGKDNFICKNCNQIEKTAQEITK